jgi:transglutaminase-like putative cysteine protease
VSDSKLFVLTDDRQFQPQGARRPLYQEPFVDYVGTYSTMYETFESAYQEANWSLPLPDTKNIFVQDNANLYRLVDGGSLTDTTELFEVLPEKPYLPLSDALSGIFSRPDEYGSVPLDAETELPELVRWLRRRIEWSRDTAREIANALNEAVVTDGSTFDPAAARRDPAIHEAHMAAKNLDPTASHINHRYVDWLKRYEL